MEEDVAFYDGRKLKVYRAEDRAAHLYRAPLLDGTERAAQAYVDRITRSAWWKRTLPRGPEFIHVFARYGGSGSYAYSGYLRKKSNFPKRGYRPWISLGTGTDSVRGNPHATDQWVILHELAHVMCRYDPNADSNGHGRDFARYYLLLVRRWLGPEAAAALRESYKAERVKYTAPRKAS